MRGSKAAPAQTAQQRKGPAMTTDKKAARAGTPAALNTASFDNQDSTPLVTGQCAQVLNLIRAHQPILSLTLTADHAIPEAAARIHDLRGMGWNIITRIIPEVEFRGRFRRNVALYSLASPEWPAPGFCTGGGDHE